MQIELEIKTLYCCHIVCCAIYPGMNVLQIEISPQGHGMCLSACVGGSALQCIVSVSELNHINSYHSNSILFPLACILNIQHCFDNNQRAKWETRGATEKCNNFELHTFHAGSKYMHSVVSKSWTVTRSYALRRVQQMRATHSSSLVHFSQSVFCVLSMCIQPAESKESERKEKQILTHGHIRHTHIACFAISHTNENDWAHVRQVMQVERREEPCTHTNTYSSCTQAAYGFIRNK